MYRILYNDSIIFDPYGNDNEVVTDASMSVEINAAAYMDFTMSRRHPLYNTIAERDGVVTLYWDGDILFQGVIESIDMDINGNKSISCVSALDYLNDTVVRPYSTVAGEQELTAPSSVNGYFQWLIDQHNKHVLDSRKRFYVGVNQGEDLQWHNFIYRSSTNNPTTASEISDQLLGTLGGYLIMKYVDGRYVLNLYSSLNTVNSQIIDFGVNITDFSKTIDTKDQYTALILKGGSPEFKGGSFESGDWSHWVTHSNAQLSGDRAHSGNVSCHLNTGYPSFVNDSFFYYRSGRHYKETLYINSDKEYNVQVTFSCQVEQSGKWVLYNVGFGDIGSEEGGDWTEVTCTFDLDGRNIPEYAKIRPEWHFYVPYADVYVDDFSFSQVIGDADVSEDPINVSMVPDGGTQYDSNILKTGDVIYDPSSVLRYGYKEEVYEDSTITNVNDLLQAGIKALIKLKSPQISLDIKAVDLSMFMKEYTHLNVGDIVRVRSAIHDIDEYLMVNSINLDLQDPGQSEYSIGKAYDSLTGQQSGIIRSLNSGINSSLDSIVSLDKTTKDQAVQISSTQQAADQAQNTATNAQSTADNAQQMSNANKEAIDSVKSNQTEYENQLKQVQKDLDDRSKDIGAVDRRVDNVSLNLASTQSDLAELKIVVSNTTDKADQASQTATSASKTANEAKTTAESALIQSNTALQTANSVKTELETNYSTTDKIAEKYATKSDVANTYLTKSDASNTYLTKSDASNTYATKATVESLENIANNAVQTWMSSGVPTLSNKPASDWTTSDLKSQHSGDIYYDSNTGYSYRFGSSDGQNYSWALVKDTDITKAIADAAKAQQTADGAQSGVNELKTSIPTTYATKTELTQKADSITTRVEEVAQSGETTSNKVSALETTTGNLQSTVDEHSSKINQNSTAISNVSQKTDSLNSTVTRVSKLVNASLEQQYLTNPDFETGDDTGWIFTNFAEHSVNDLGPNTGTYKIYVKPPSNNNVQTIINTKVFSVVPGQRFRLSASINVDNAMTKDASLGFLNSDDKTKFVASVVNVDSTQYNYKTYTAIVTIPEGWSKAQFRFATIDTGYVTMRLDSFMVLDVSAGLNAQDTANNAITSLNTLSNKADITYPMPFLTNTNNYWIRLGTATISDQGRITQLTLNVSKGNNGQPSQNAKAIIQIHRGWYGGDANHQFGVSVDNSNWKEILVKAISNETNKVTIWIYNSVSPYLKGNYTVSGWRDSWEDQGLTQTDIPTGTEQQVAINISLEKFVKGISTNLIKNPGFETGDLDQWVFDSGMSNIFVNNVNPHGDSYKLIIQTPSTNSWTMKSNTVTVVKNHTYEISFWVWADKAVNAKLGIYAGGNYSTSYVAISASTSWQRISVRRTLQDSYSDACISFGFPNAISESNNIRIDDFELRDITEGYDASGVANSALTKASSLEQTLNEFKTTVSQTYAPKASKLIWSGNVNQGGNFTCSEAPYYNVFAARLDADSTLMLGIRSELNSSSGSIALLGTDPTAGSYQGLRTCSLTFSNETSVTVTDIKVGTSNDSTKPLTELWGIL